MKVLIKHKSEDLIIIDITDYISLNDCLDWYSNWCGFNREDISGGIISEINHIDCVVSSILIKGNRSIDKALDLMYSSVDSWYRLDRNIIQDFINKIQRTNKLELLIGALTCTLPDKHLLNRRDLFYHTLTCAIDQNEYKQYLLDGLE